ncbi:MAG: hypothetical protein FWC91_01950 [Defluviitaleaceae bacterium]|nr:hypothetical protein [Defluviitaleaceae bacterium]
MSAFTFRYNGVSSKDYGIYATEQDFFSPPKRQGRKKIDFRHGTYDFENNMYDNRILNLNCFWKDPKVRHDIREITLWLSRKGPLVLDIEPYKHYMASLYDSSELNAYYYRGFNNNQTPTGTFNLSFFCDPFAYSDQTISRIATGYTDINYHGTASTPTLIILRNNNNVPVRNITVTALSLL